LRVTTRDLGSGSGLTANRINQSNAFGTLSCLRQQLLFSSTSALLIDPR